MSLKKIFVLISLCIALCLLPGCGGVLGDFGSLFGLLFGNGFFGFLSLESQLITAPTLFVGAIALGITQIEYRMIYGLCTISLVSLQAQAKYCSFQIASFMYHFPVAQQWAQMIANDPLTVTNQIVGYYQAIMYGPWPIGGAVTPLSQSLAWGVMPDDAGNGLSIKCPLAALVLTQGNLNTTDNNPGTLQESITISAAGDNTELAAAIAAAPYTGPNTFNVLDYLALPISYALSLCATNPDAWNSVCAIVFSPQMFQLYSEMDEFLANPANAPSYAFTLNGNAQTWTPATPGEFFVTLISMVIKASMGPAYFLPYNPSPATLPTASNSFNVLAGYLLGSEALGAYLESLDTVVTTTTETLYIQLSVIGHTNSPGSGVVNPGQTPTYLDPTDPNNSVANIAIRYNTSVSAIEALNNNAFLADLGTSAAANVQTAIYVPAVTTGTNTSLSSNIASEIMNLIQGSVSPPGVVQAVPNPNVPELPAFTNAQSQSVKLAGALTLGALAAGLSSHAKGRGEK